LLRFWILRSRAAAGGAAALGLVALVLAALGIYAVIAFAVSHRTRELGIRMALGANARDVLGLVLGEGGRLIAIGLLIGTAAAFASAPLFGQMLFGISAFDPVTYAVVMTFLAAVALAAYIPARRAAALEPVIALARGVRADSGQPITHNRDPTMFDFKHAFRMLRKRPAFTLVAVLTLALGIGANTAIFSVVNGVLLRPLPYPEPDRIVQLWESAADGHRMPVSHPNFLDWRQQATGFEAMAQYAGGTETVLGGREPVFAQAYGVSDGFFRVFATAPAIGRTFVAEEMREAGVPAVVVSHSFWEHTLGGQADLSQLRVIIAGMSARVVGVMPEGFDYPRADLWVPSELSRDDSGRTGHNYFVVARLKNGVSMAQASAEMNTIAAQLKRQHGEDENAVAVTMLSLGDALTAGSRDALLLLLGSVGLVLLIACANVATTMLARGEERRTELAVRAALGAARGRLVRQLLVESLVLGSAGAVAGLLLAAWLVRALISINAVALPRAEGIGIDGRVLLFTLLIALMTSLLFGLAPSLQASRADLREALTEGGRGAAAPTRARIRAVLVTAEVAIALLLLVGSALLIRSFANVMSVDAGFDTRGAITATMAVPGSKYPDAPRSALFYDGLLERVRRLPGVLAVGAVNQLPLSGGNMGGSFQFQGAPADRATAAAPYAGYRIATPGYLEAMKVRLLRGRTLLESDRAGTQPVAVVNEAFVRQYLSRTNPIGVRFKYFGMDPVNPVFTIVGVVKDVHHRSLVRAVDPEVFASAYQQPFRARGTMTVVVRAANAEQQGAVARAVRETLRQFDPDVPAELSTLDHLVTDSVADRRFLLMVLGAFAFIALLLAATGIYSVLSQSVAQRTQEIGVRMALGADARSVVRLVLATAMRSVVSGLVLGVIGAVASERVIASFLFNVAPIDPAAFTGAAVLLLLVALLAGYIPARRATRVDPLLALRAQ
jgi:putative ABC transport system permease protein